MKAILPEGVAKASALPGRTQPERLKIALTVYAGVKDNTGVPQVTSWGGMVEKFKNPTFYPSKRSCPLFAAATFNGSREAVNLLSFAAVVADYDGKVEPGVSLDEMCRRIENSHVEVAVYTTGRHTADAPRLRVVAPLSREHAPDEHGEMLDLLNGAVGGCLDAESWTSARVYFFGAVEGVEYACRHVRGMPLDQAAIFLDSIGKPNIAKAQAEASRTLARAAGTDADVDLGRAVALGRVDEKTLADLRSALQVLDPDRRELWTTVGQNLQCLGDRGKGLWLEWSARSTKFRDGKDDPDQVWDGLSGDRSDYRAVFTKAQATGWVNPGSGRAEAAGTPVGAAILKTPVAAAELFRKERYTVDGRPGLQRWRGDFYEHSGTAYQLLGDEQIAAEVYAWCSRHGWPIRGRSVVENIMHALKAISNVPDGADAPCWLDGEPLAPVEELVAVDNGLLHLPARKLFPHTPVYFNLNATMVPFVPAAGAPHWLAFLTSVFGDDQQSIELLQEWIGYCLTRRTSLQKGLLLVGPKRAGKGIVTRITTAVVGDSNVASSSLSQIGSQFGRENWIGKSMVIVPDARIAKGTDIQSAAEVVLSMTGEDAISIDRKHRRAWIGTLHARLMIVTNVLPGLVDAGGAFASRFMILRFPTSFFGREDTGLMARLLPEMPGILNWALEGLARLEARGRFVQPESSAASIKELERKSTPLLGFVEDCFEMDAESWVSKDVVHQQYLAWASRQGRRFELTRDNLFSEMYGLSLGLSDYRPRAKGKPVRAVRGIKLRADANDNNVDFQEIPDADPP